MRFIFNERYSTIMEDVLVYDNKFICAYLPVYGLVKIDNVIIKISDHEGFAYTQYNEDTIRIIYIVEKVYTDGYRGKELNEKEIYKILKESC